MLYPLLRSLWHWASLLPWGLLYWLSDRAIYPLLYHLFQYRRGLVRQHLSDCFPEKNEAERQQIERRFYHYLADLFVELIKEKSISRSEMQQRMRFTNLQEILAQAQADPAQHYFLYLGHYGNWEWVASLPLWHEAGIQFGQIYHPLHNAAIDRLLLEVRGRFGAENIAMEQTLRTLIGHHRAGRRTMIGFISDQVPRIEAMNHWQPFLQHDTAFFTGAEKIGQKIGARFFYLDITRPRRGYYEGVIRELQPEAGNSSPFPITDAYVRAFEASIRRQPELWLWTHNRWKRTRATWEAHLRELENKRHQAR